MSIRQVQNGFLKMVLFGLILALSACAGSTQQTPTVPAMTPHMDMTTNPSDAEFDQMFIDMMVTHHQGAVEMAKIAQGRANHPEIKTLADSIIASQQDEITKMQGWRETWYESSETPPMSAMPMLPGMTEMSNIGIRMTYPHG